MTFDDPRIQQYLATRDIVVLGTINPDGSPLVTAMSFLHEPSALTLISVDNLQKVRNLRRDPRLHIVAESGSRGAEIKGVAMRGRAEFLGDSPERRALATRILDKYHSHLETTGAAARCPRTARCSAWCPSRCAPGGSNDPLPRRRTGPPRPPRDRAARGRAGHHEPAALAAAGARGNAPRRHAGGARADRRLQARRQDGVPHAPVPGDRLRTGGHLHPRAGRGAHRSR